MRYLISAMLVVVGVIHLLPLAGVLGSDRLASLYGVPFTEPNLEILMRHRAVLFGLLGAFLVFAAFKPAYQTLAYIAGLVSVVSFLYLAWSVGGYNEQVGRVFMAERRPGGQGRVRRARRQRPRDRDFRRRGREHARDAAPGLAGDPRQLRPARGGQAAGRIG